MILLLRYFDKIRDKLDQVINNEHKQLLKAAEEVAACIAQGGIVHLFGCGHSHILTEEVFFRAGGLAPLRPIFFEPLMLHEGAATSSQLERRNGYAAGFMDEQDIRPGEIVFVLSTSGRNPVPVDVALIGKKKGAYVIGITSLEYSLSQPARHDSGQHLCHVVDLVIDNHADIGDASLDHPQLQTRFAPSSTVVGSAILNAVFSEAIRLLIESHGVEPPVFGSGNLDGMDHHNERLLTRYRERIPLLC